MHPSKQATMYQISHGQAPENWQAKVIKKLDKMYDEGYRFSVEMDSNRLAIHCQNVPDQGDGGASTG